MLATLLSLTACGSRPLRQPVVETDIRSDMQLGMQAYQNNNYTEARNYFARVLGKTRSVDDRAGELNALIDLADSALGQGEYRAARDYLGNAEQIIASGQFAAVKPQVALLSAYASMQAGDSKQAATQLDALLHAPTTPADVHRAALFARTQTAFDLEAADAGAWLDKLGSTVGKNPGALLTARYQRLEALAASHGGAMQQAAALYASALDTYRAHYFRPGIAATLEEWAALSMQRKDWAAARSQLQRALNVRLSMYDRTHSIRNLENLQRMDTTLGDSAAALEDAKLANSLKDGGNPADLPINR